MYSTELTLKYDSQFGLQTILVFKSKGVVIYKVGIGICGDSQVPLYLTKSNSSFPFATSSNTSRFNKFLEIFYSIGEHYLREIV